MPREIDPDLILATFDPDAPPERPQPPDRWNEAWVMERIKSGYEVLSRLPGGVGPKQLKAAWVPYFHEFGDLTSQSESGQLEETVEERRDQMEGWRPRADPHEIDLMDEALSWPMHYLANMEMPRKALTTWGMMSARGQPFSDSLFARRLKRPMTVVATAARVIAGRLHADGVMVR